jgi:ferredoxin-nitrite reductase
VERNKCRLAFLIEAWGIERFRKTLESQWFQKTKKSLLSSGVDVRLPTQTDHLGVRPQKQAGLVSVGLCVPIGRITAKQLYELARLAELYGTGEVRITSQQNMILVNIPSQKLETLLQEPLLTQLSPNPTPFFRGLVTCVGTDYCSLALIETKGIGFKVSQELEKRLGKETLKNFRIHWSGCAAGCGNHHTADIGLQGIKANIDGKIVDAVHIFVGGKTGKDARHAEKIMELVPCDILPDLLEVIIRNMNILQKVRRDVEAESRVVMVPADMSGQ